VAVKWKVDTEDGQKVVKREFHPQPVVGGCYQTKSGKWFKVTRVLPKIETVRCILIGGPYQKAGPLCRKTHT
jgi:hypothetical protein